MNKAIWIGASAFFLGILVGRLFDRDSASVSVKPDASLTPAETGMLPRNAIKTQPGNASSDRDPNNDGGIDGENGPGEQLESIEDEAERFANLDATKTSQSWALSRFVARYFRERSEEAVEWVLGLKEQRGLFEAAYRTLGEEMARNGEFDRVVNLVEELPSSPGVDALFDGLLIATAKVDPEKAIQIRTLNPGLGKVSNQKYLFRLSTLSGHPDKAMAAVRRYVPKAQQTELIVNIYNQWATQDPGAAVASLVELPPSRTKNQGFHWAVRAWAQHDYYAAEDWVLHTMEPSTARDQAVGGLVEHLRTTLSRDAFTLAQEIQNEELRFLRLENVAADWLAHDPDEAMALINATNLSPEIKRQLIESKKP